ncbi:hypothetical protein [Pedobacter cryoconitis]|uniref:hypothetical protein n=1 Tax=Pedobacter cryoconitis TaxID=188932 RepID=UPI001618EDD7|nr:hypothetical protein [Pedobacter cryoconitis]MBB5645582.1 hypothetical protein [Pedobacter cryoconitis]
MKNKILIYLSGIIAILALCFGAFYYNFFGGSDPRIKEAENKNSMKTFSVINNTDSHLFLVSCFQYSKIEIENYKKKGISISNLPEFQCKDTLELKGKNDLGYNQLNQQLPLAKFDAVRLPASFLLTILDTNKVVLKKYNRAVLEKMPFDTSGKSKEWYFNIEIQNNKIQLVNAK